MKNIIFFVAIISIFAAALYIAEKKLADYDISQQESESR